MVICNMGDEGVFGLEFEKEHNSKWVFDLLLAVLLLMSIGGGNR